MKKFLLATGLALLIAIAGTSPSTIEATSNYQVVAGGVLTGTACTPIITSPTTSSAYDAGSSATLDLSGTAYSDNGVASVTYVNSLGGSGTAAGTTSWSITGLALTTGSNVITISCNGRDGSINTDIITVTRSGGVQQFRTCTSPHGSFAQPVSLVQSVVQTSVTNASDGDVVCLPAGTATWTTILLINTSTSRPKMVTLQGAGIGTSASDPTATVITANNNSFHLDRSGIVPAASGAECCPIIAVFTNRTLATFELSNIRFIQGSVWNGTTLGSQENEWGFILAGNADDTTKQFRIHHLWIEYNTTNDGGEGVNGSIINFGHLGGNFTSDTVLDLAHTYIIGVIDHNTFHGSGSFQCIDILPRSGRTYNPPSGGGITEGNVSGILAWETDLSAHMGTSFNVFFEDNTVFSTAWNNNNACIDANAGGTWVVRHNTFTNNWIGGHGNDGDRSVKWEEIYDNIFIVNSSTGSVGGATSLRGGTGVYYNNRFCDAAHTCGLTITGSNVWPVSLIFELQYYRAYIPTPTDQRGIKNGTVDCAGTNFTIPTAANTALTLGCDNRDHVSPATDAGWLAGEQPGSKKGTSQPTWVWGYNYAAEPVVAWANYLGSGTSTPAILGVFDTGSSDFNDQYMQARRDYISIDGTAADCTTHMAESICLAFWDPSGQKKAGYTAYTYPNPRTAGP